MFTSPLDNIRVASPCPADWDQMFGDDRTRFCSDCKLNVYNLSGMTREEAESLLINAEGRVCVRFYRRADGTVLTANCPVGWAAVKRRVSGAATAAVSMVIGFATGVLGFRLAESVGSSMVTVQGAMAVPTADKPNGSFPVMGSPAIDVDQYVVGRLEL